MNGNTFRCNNSKLSSGLAVFFVYCLVTIGLFATSLFYVSVGAFAAGNEVIDKVGVEVPVSCTMIGTGTSSHTDEVPNGTHKSNIGETSISAFCNDSSGFSIYAIGYTDNIDGKNVLTNTSLGYTYDIATGTSTSGNDSAWAMKLSSVTSPTPTHPIIIAGSADDTDKETGDPDFSDFTAVPDDYTVVAKRKASTDVGASAEGASLKTTYQVYISQNQPSGVYNGKVKYTMVHPYDGMKPILCKPQGTTISTIRCMQDFNTLNIATVLDSMVAGQRYTLIDSRDGEVYGLAKLADGNVWMVDNLRLDPSNASTASNMNESNTNASAAAISNYLSGGNPGSISGWSSKAVKNVTSSWGWDSYKEPYINNQSVNDEVTSFGINDGKIGLYYNYCAATVGTYCYSGGSTVDLPDTLIDAPNDICPSSWRLPTGGPNGEIQGLAMAINSTTGSVSDSTQVNTLNTGFSISLAGAMFSDHSYDHNNYQRFWSSTVKNSYSMYGLVAYPNLFNPQYDPDTQYGYSMRCIVQPELNS